jgi:predicted ester cyclase
MSPSHTEQLTKALRIGLTGEVGDLGDLFTEDVVGWSPIMSVSSREELSKAFGEREDALSDIVLDIDAIDVIGEKAIAEWRFSGIHSGPVSLGDDLTIEPTGQKIVLAGATFAEFRGDQIRVFRSYFDDAALLEQMLAPA